MPKATRLNLRIAEATDARIRRAAAVSGVSVSAFVADAAGAAADHVLADRRHFELDAEQWERFEQALDRPARDLPELRRGIEERERLLGS